MDEQYKFQLRAIVINHSITIFNVIMPWNYL